MAGYHYRGEFDDPAPGTDLDRVGAIGGAQLRQDVLDVDLDRVLGDRQDFTDVAVAVAGSDETQRLDFTRGERVVGEI